MFKIPLINLTVVDLPAPFGPISPTILPSSIKKAAYATYFFHERGLNNTKIGNSSSLPAIMLNDNINLEMLLNPLKLRVGPTVLKPGPILLKVAATEEKAVAKSSCQKEIKSSSTANITTYAKK